MTNAGAVQRDGRTRAGVAVEKPAAGRAIPSLPSDPVERARALHELYDAVLSGATTGSVPRSLVSDSWQRSLAARVDPDRHDPPVVHRAADIEGVRAAHPLGAVLPLLRSTLVSIADEAVHVMIVTDADGTILWREGAHSLLRAADSVGLAPGMRWSEDAIGTNAMGTALAVDEPVQIHSAEHLVRLYHSWTCAAAPIHDPASGKLLGAIDVTGGDHLANPHSLALVRATALAAEAYLSSHLPPPAGAGTVLALGRDEAVLTIDGRRIRLGRRHSELLVLLLVHPEGRTGEQVGFDLYRDDQNPVTVRAELSRLRRTLGPAVLDSRPYRVRVELDADFLDVTRQLDRGRVADALAAYAGPLLPSSDAPGVERLRRLMDDRLRAAVVASRDQRLLRTWVESRWGADDLVAWEAYVSLEPGNPLSRRRVADLSREYGVATSLQRARN